MAPDGFWVIQQTVMKLNEWKTPEPVAAVSKRKFEKPGPGRKTKRKVNEEKLLLFLKKEKEHGQNADTNKG